MEEIDFCNNSAWFNIELLLMTFNLQDNMKCMKDKTYASAVENICEKERIPILRTNFEAAGAS